MFPSIDRIYRVGEPPDNSHDWLQLGGSASLTDRMWSAIEKSPQINYNCNKEKTEMYKLPRT